MRNLVILLCGVLTFLLNSKPCIAQTPLCQFNPAHVIYIGAVGTDTAFTTRFSWYLGPADTPSGVRFGCTPGISMDPTDAYFGISQDGFVDVKVTVNIDSIMDSMSYCSSEISPPQVYTPYAAFFIHAYRYDTKIKGKIRLMNDTVNFGRVAVGTTMFEPSGVSIDKAGSIFRYLNPLNVKAPFAWADSIAPAYFGDCSDPQYALRPSFTPTETKIYIDSINIYDPIQNDSTLLILLGEGVAASVPENPVASELRIYPNPADREATISLSAGAMQMVTIYNVMGDAVMQLPESGEDYHTLNTSALPSGLYHLEAVTKQGVYRERLVVEH